MKKVRPYKENGLEGINIEQVCALDLLFDDDIPIKIITGLAGSGKTYLATNWAFDNVLHGNVNKFNKTSKVMVFRNPEGDTDTKQIGF
jgi:predicted ribonuclease YlaK